MGVSASNSDTAGAGATSAPSPPSEIPALTSLRGVLALWVVFYHFWNDVDRLFPSMSALRPLMLEGHMAVPAFFMLSGFVLSYNYARRFTRLRGAEVLRFLVLRLARIYPVHLTTLLVVLAMVAWSEAAGYQLDDRGYTLRDFVLNVFLIHTWTPDFRLNWNYPSWSISSEWFAYILFPFMVRLLLCRLTTPLRAGLFAAVSLGGSIAMMLYWRPWPLFELLLVVPTFFAGAAVHWLLVGRYGICRSQVVKWLPEMLALLAVATPFVFPIQAGVAILFACFLGLILLHAFLGANCHSVWTARPLVFLGKVSYSLYMTHTLAQKVLYRLLPTSSFESASFPTRFGVLAVYALLILAACLASYYLVEKPSREYFKRVLRRSRGSE